MLTIFFRLLGSFIFKIKVRTFEFSKMSTNQGWTPRQTFCVYLLFFQFVKYAREYLIKNRCSLTGGRHEYTVVQGQSVIDQSARSHCPERPAGAAAKKGGDNNCTLEGFAFRR